MSLDDLGHLLRAARGDRSLQTVAPLLAVGPMTFRAWENGFSRPKPSRAAAIAHFLGLSEYDVLVVAGYLESDPPEASGNEGPTVDALTKSPTAEPRADAFQLYRDWWADVPRRLGTATCKCYRRELFAALADLGKHPNAVLTRHLEAHLGEMRPQHASLRRAALMDFFEWMQRQGHRPDNPLATIRQPKMRSKKIRRGMSHDELWRMVFAALWMGENGVRGTGYRVAWAMLVQYGLCLRPGELVKLTKDRVKLDGPTPCVFITETKTGNDRTLPVVGVARVALEELAALSPGDKLLPWGTTFYWEKVRAAAQLAGLPPEKCRPYALRHTGATHLAERGVHPRLIAEILGHVDLRHVMTYTQPGDEALREALGRLGD